MPKVSKQISEGFQFETPAADANTPRKPLLRSPNYPLVGLARAVELLTAMYGKFGTHPVPPTFLNQLWKVKPGSGVGNQWLAALKAYGLVVTIGDGVERKALVSKEGVRVAMNAPDRSELLKQAALKPTIHSWVARRLNS
jgi:hypothetical protein